MQQNHLFSVPAIVINCCFWFFGIDECRAMLLTGTYISPSYFFMTDTKNMKCQDKCYVRFRNNKSANYSLLDKS
jgi:hypothetical protein